MSKSSGEKPSATPSAGTAIQQAQDRPAGRAMTRPLRWVIDLLAVVFGWGCAYYQPPDDSSRCMLCSFGFRAHVPFWLRTER